MQPIARLAVPVLALVIAGCAGAGAAEQPTTPEPVIPAPPALDGDGAEPAPTAPPALRLGDQVVPLAYRAELTIDPASDEFAGIIHIDVNVLEQIDHIWLHATELEIAGATLEAGGQRLPLERLATSNQDFLGLALGRSLPPGQATLRIDYRGRISPRDFSGLFKQTEGAHTYVFTQFQPIAARLVFPSFDEPRFKVPWQLTLHVPEGNLALANTPAVEDTPGPAPGMRTVRFAPTRPIPSYLVAMAVGPFDVVELGAIGRNATPARIVVPRGRAAEARYAAEVTPRLLELIEDYFDMPYPYEKLDSVAVPSFFGGMENPGLITYSAGVILAPPGRESLLFKRTYAGIASHELAHQWFGNLVTLGWWDDTWLNESFATWMANKIVSAWQPKWSAEVFRVNQAAAAMTVDSLVTAPSMRKPIETSQDILGVFSAISYGKGSTVLSMFERWIGEERMRAGIRSYLRAFAWGTATADDFLAALAQISTPEVPGAFQTFLDQSGVPLVSMRLICDHDRPAVLELAQERLLPVGSRGAEDRIWQVPVCIRYGKDTRVASDCVLMTERNATLTLGHVRGCPEWVLGNAGGAGYYRVAYAHHMLARLFVTGKKHLSAAERVAVIGDLSALMSAGKLRVGDVLALVPTVLNDPSPHVLSALVEALPGAQSPLIPDAMRANYQRFVRKTFGARARKLGWSATRRDSDDTRLLRRALLTFTVAEGEEPALVRQAVQRTRAWLQTRKGIDPELLPLVLATGARHGGPALYEELVQALEASQDPHEQRALIDAVAQTQDPERIQKNLAMLFSGAYGLRESAPLLQVPLEHPVTRQIVYEHIKSHFDALVTQMPRYSSARLIHVARSFCDDAHHQDARTFFGPRAADMPGGAHALAQALEHIELCMARRALHQPSAARFLERH